MWGMLMKKLEVCMYEVSMYAELEKKMFYWEHLHTSGISGRYLDIFVPA